MKLTATIDIKQIQIENLMSCHKPDEVSQYCQNCSNYGRNHSCPHFDFDCLDYLEGYQYATIVMTHIDTKSIRDNIDDLQQKSFDSRVFTNYKKHNPDVKTDWNSKLSMYVFNQVKDDLCRELLRMEKDFAGSLSLPPGSCTRCSVCMRTEGDTCVLPNDLRYSLEALGFLVSDIYKQFFDTELGWTQGELPESFNTCSALLSKDQLDIEALRQNLGMIEIAL